MSFLSERMKIEIVEKLEANLHDKTKYVIHIRNLKQELNHRSVLKKVQRVLKFNQNGCLKPYIDMNTDLRKKAQNGFEKDLFKLMKFFFLEKLLTVMLENIQILQQKEEQLVTTERRRNYLVSEPNCYTTNIFKESLLAIDMKKTEILMNKPAHLGHPVLEISKVLMYDFWYDYVKPKYGEKVKLCYMDTDSFIVYIKTEDIYKDIAENVETRFDTSNYKLQWNSINRPLPNGNQ